MVDLYNGERPANVIGYKVDEENNLVVECSDSNESYKTLNSIHNMNAINRQMESQVREYDCSKNLSRLIALNYIQIFNRSFLTLYIMDLSYEKDRFTGFTALAGLLLGFTSIIVKQNILEIKENKKLLQAYKKYLYFINNKENFLLEGETDLDNTYININDLESFTLKDLKRIAKN